MCSKPCMMLNDSCGIRMDVVSPLGMIQEVFYELDSLR